MAGKTILNLSTLDPDRIAINIDGTRYELNAREDFGIRELTRLEHRYKAIQRLQDLKPEDFTEDDAVILEQTMDEFCRMLLRDCPDEIHARLKDGHRLMIFGAFQQAAGDDQTTAPPPSQTVNRAGRRQIGAKSSSRSATSTTGRSTSGST